ncbi:MAG: alpha,alpha-trehalase [Polaribacter sp.]|jgi:alpha,alpha-trehalase
MKYQTPDQIYGDLFVDLHLQPVLKDGKLISDATALFPPAEIVAAYDVEKGSPGFDLPAFFKKHFKVNTLVESNFKTDRSKSAEEHIRTLWDVLSRPADVAEEGSSIIPLPHPYLVPGGRFNEIYYWDSFFTMLGLKIHNRWDIIEGMIQNFSWFIDNIGFIPNGNRSYFLSRSQPPFFAMMVSLLAKEKGDAVLVKYLPQLKKEYAFWMNGQVQLSDTNQAFEHVVKLKGGVLNRYYDRSPLPRQEMHKDDAELIEESTRESQKLCLDIRSACESGWDFTSRWFDNEQELSTINTSEIIPVDLNCLLYILEQTIAKACRLSNDMEESKSFLAKADKRKELIQKYCWNSETGFFHDYQFVQSKRTAVISAAGVYPLCFNIATKEQAAQVAENITTHLLFEGGVACTPITSGQQWDSPNGWAPLQWMTVAGLEAYGFDKEALTVAERWTSLNEKVYQNTGKFMEKYNVVDLSLDAGGGEYPVQDGFGWSNGVYLALKEFIKTS